MTAYKIGYQHRKLLLHIIVNVYVKDPFLCFVEYSDVPHQPKPPSWPTRSENSVFAEEDEKRRKKRENA